MSDVYMESFSSKKKSSGLEFTKSISKTIKNIQKDAKTKKFNQAYHGENQTSRNTAQKTMDKASDTFSNNMGSILGHAATYEGLKYGYKGFQAGKKAVKSVSEDIKKARDKKKTESKFTDEEKEFIKQYHKLCKEFEAAKIRAGRVINSGRKQLSKDDKKADKLALKGTDSTGHKIDSISKQDMQLDNSVYDVEKQLRKLAAEKEKMEKRVDDIYYLASFRESADSSDIDNLRNILKLKIFESGMNDESIDLCTSIIDESTDDDFFNDMESVLNYMDTINLYFFEASDDENLENEYEKYDDMVTDLKQTFKFMKSKGEHVSAAEKRLFHNKLKTALVYGSGILGICVTSAPAIIMESLMLTNVVATVCAVVSMLGGVLVFGTVMDKKGKKYFREDIQILRDIKKKLEILREKTKSEKDLRKIDQCTEIVTDKIRQYESIVTDTVITRKYTDKDYTNA